MSLNIYEAVKSGRPLRRKSSPRIVGSSGEGWVCPRFLVDNLIVEMADLLADDWEIQEPSVTVTYGQLYAALAEVLKECDDANVFFSVTRSRMDPIKELTRRLGLEPK